MEPAWEQPTTEGEEEAEEAWQNAVVCSTSLMASLIRSVGGLSKYFYRGLWLDYLNADVIGQSINRHGVV